MKRFLASYGFDGGQWSFEIKAESHEDAERRLAAIKAWGRIDGEIGMTIPAMGGSWLPSLVVRLLNGLRL